MSKTILPTMEALEWANRGADAKKRLLRLHSELSSLLQIAVGGHALMLIFWLLGVGELAGVRIWLVIEVVIAVAVVVRVSGIGPRARALHARLSADSDKAMVSLRKASEQFEREQQAEVDAKRKRVQESKQSEEGESGKLEENPYPTVMEEHRRGRREGRRITEDIIDRVKIIVRVNIVLYVTVSGIISISWGVGRGLDQVNMNEPCCPTVNVACASTPVIVDSVAWFVPAGTAGMSDSTLMAVVRDGNQTFLQAVREEHKVALEQLKEMKQQPPVVIGSEGGGWFSWPFALVLLVLGLIALLGYLGKGAHDAKLQKQLAWIAAGATVFVGLAGIYAAYLQRSDGGGAGGATIQNVNNYGYPCPGQGPTPLEEGDTIGITIKLDSLRIALGDLKHYIAVHCGKGGGGPVTVTCPECPDVNVDLNTIVTAIENLGDRLDTCCEQGPVVDTDLKCLEGELAYWQRLATVTHTERLIEDSTMVRLCANARDANANVRFKAQRELRERCAGVELRGYRYYVDRDSTLLQLERQVLKCGSLTFPLH